MNHLPHVPTGPLTFGMELVVDIDNCAPDVITSEMQLRQFSESLVRHIKMTAFGEPQIVHFGHNDPITAGYTLVQLIETSSIVGHFSEHLRRAHLNIFSCREFDPEAAAEFCATTLYGVVGAATVLIR